MMMTMKGYNQDTKTNGNLAPPENICLTTPVSADTQPAFQPCPVLEVPSEWQSDEMQHALKECITTLQSVFVNRH